MRLVFRLTCDISPSRQMEPDEENAQLVLLNGAVQRKEGLGTNSETVPYTTGQVTFRSASARVRKAIAVINISLLLIGKFTYLFNGCISYFIHNLTPLKASMVLYTQMCIVPKPIYNVAY